MPEENTVTAKKTSLILVLSLIVVFAIGLVGGLFISGASILGSSAQTVANNAVNYINNNLVQPGTTASLVSVKESNGLYNITISYQGTETFILVTKDGSYLILPQGIINMKSTIETPETSGTINIEGSAVEGSSDAKLTVVEFSDFQCPYCEKFWSETLPQLKQNYIDTGKIKFVYKHFPLGFHENAQKAAEAAECASNQGKFWVYHDKLYSNQETLDITSLKQYAKDLGLDSTKFDSCLDNNETSTKVNQDLQEGQDSGVTGTPSFFILDNNGKILRMITGAQPYSAFQEILDAALANT